MNETELKKLCLDLVHSDSESEVVSVLKSASLWDDSSYWKYYGDNENNFSTIGNQQSTAEAALVEKIINSVDAVLMRECFKKGINPESSESPQSLEEALSRFFNIYKGKLTNLDSRMRGGLANNIMVVATGEKRNPCYAIIDTGEGQSPNKIPATFLSLTKSNKLRIPFVQGKFNMGATGSLQFCGQNNIQLIVSKRSTEITSTKTEDESSDYWGFTVIRRENPSMGIRSSAFKYLAPEGKILRFKADTLPLVPGNYPQPFGNPLKSGSYVKLFEYQLKGGLKTAIKFDLYYKLSLLLPSIALPVTLYERRSGYRMNTYHSVMSGLSVRLDEDKRDNLETDFPSSAEIQVQNEKMKVLIYAFKKDQAKKYTLGEGIIFTINGQTHGTLPKAFFERKTVGMSYLSDAILVLADCSAFSGRIREDLFMNSRDRLREGTIKNEIVSQLEDILRNHEGLRALRERRRREDLENILQDSKPLTEVLDKIIKNSPSLSKLFLQGHTIQNPFNTVGAGVSEEFKGKKYPTFFKLRRNFTIDNPKSCSINRKFRIQFETDVENQYFKRDNDPGEYLLTWEDVEIKTHSLSLWNGLATLSVVLPDCVKEDDLLSFKFITKDISQTNPFINEFIIKVIQPAEESEGSEGERTEPPSDQHGQTRLKIEALSLPNINECRKTQGDNYKFKGNEEGALIVKDSGENGYDFYVNMDNTFLKTDMKGTSNIDPRLLESQFKYGMVLIGLSCLNDFSKNDEKNSDVEQSIYDQISSISKAISPILLPMISGLSEMQLGE